jgi:hypothetical protein
MSEQQTLGFEAIKQLTTLNAGSIVVIGTFLSNIFPTDKQGALTVPLYIKVLIGAAFVWFGASLILSVLAMIEYRFGSKAEPRFILPLTSFTGGIICFGAAVLLNLFR